MRPPPQLRRSAWGLTFDTPVGIGAGLDPSVRALPALARFGVGFVEVGPVTLAPLTHANALQRRLAKRAIWRVDAPVNAGVEAITERLAAVLPLPVPLGVRLAHRPDIEPALATHECAALIQRLAPLVDFFTLETSIASREGMSGSPTRLFPPAHHPPAASTREQSRGRIKLRDLWVVPSGELGPDLNAVRG